MYNTEILTISQKKQILLKCIVLLRLCLLLLVLTINSCKSVSNSSRTLGVTDIQNSRIKTRLNQTEQTVDVQGVRLEIVGEQEYQSGEIALLKINIFNETSKKKYIRIVEGHNSHIKIKRRYKGGGEQETTSVHSDFDEKKKKICNSYQSKLDLIVNSQEGSSLLFAVDLPIVQCRKNETKVQSSIEQEFIVSVSTNPLDCEDEIFKTVTLVGVFDIFCNV